MAVIVETRHLGIHCGRTWTILLLIISILYLLICLGTTLISRLYLKGFYSAAHVAAISAVASLFVICHHFGRLRKTLGVTKKFYSVYQIGLNAYFLLCCLATAIGYSILLSYTINTNYDYLGAMWFGWMNTVLLSYMLGVVISSCCTDRSDSYDLQHDMNTFSRIHFNETTMSNNGFDEDESPISTFRKRSRTKYADDPNFNVDDPDNPTYLPPPELMPKPESKSSKYCKMCCRSFFWIFYIILQLILIVIFFMTAYHPYCVLVDFVKFREDSVLHTVKVDNHRPQALFLHCHGSGSDTIVFESDIRTTALMYFDGLPKYMADQHGFRVCVYDRRGKGWSEGLENDFIDSHQEEPQWSKSNVQFLKELVKVAKIKTPFYYAGFGYGSHHVTYMALDNSRLLKGLIYINPVVFGKNNIQQSQTNNNYSRFDDLKDDSFVAEIYANFYATGFIRLAEQLGISSVEEHFENYADFSMLSADKKKSLFASLGSNSYFPSQVRENDKYLLNGFAREYINRDIFKKKIGKPVIIVEGSASGIEPVLKWFPKEQFLQFSTSNVLTVRDATYNSMVLSDSRYMKITAEFIKDKLSLI